jgi:hypothetical protein
VLLFLLDAMANLDQVAGLEAGQEEGFMRTINFLLQKHVQKAFATYVGYSVIFVVVIAYLCFSIVATIGILNNQLSTTQLPTLDALSKISGVCNTIIFAAGLLFTFFQLRSANISRAHSNLSAILGRNYDLNQRTEDDPCRRIAAELFIGFNMFDAEASSPSDGTQKDKLYWGARAYLMDLITLLLQVWLLAGKPSKMTGDFAGWEVVAKAVSQEINGISYHSKPDWYIRVCDDIRTYLSAGRIYSANFVRWLNNLQE